jgi:uncharacterized protein (TIGR02594 family)
MTAILPAEYQYLRQQPLPPVMVRIALEMLGTWESPGTADNPVIIGWADEIERICSRPYDCWAADFYNKDSIPWCGLFVGVVAARACQGRPERMPPNKYLAALAWSSWGETVSPEDIEVGDVIVLVRDGGGHVFIALGVSEDGEWIMGVGGNQTDGVTIAEFKRERLYGVRRPLYKNKPKGARRVILPASGAASNNEA